jgi:CheY-like chemotaxis protein
MSLVGNLEDLGLGEILQIVSLSRRSGILSLESRGREARVIFRSGQVIRASSSTYQQNLGEVLIQKGVIDLPTLKRALSIQADEGFQQLLGAILIDRFGIGSDAIETVAREQIESVVYALFAWAEGTFEFELQEVEGDPAKHEPAQYLLKQGLNPQYLAMEGSRIIDEQRHRDEFGAEEDGAAGGDDSVDFAFDLLQEPAAPAAENQEQVSTEPAVAASFPAAAEPHHAPATDPFSRIDSNSDLFPGGFGAVATEPTPEPVPTALHSHLVPLVLVDDDPLTLEQLTALLQQQGYRVEALEKSEDALIRVDNLYREGERPSVVIDMIMPRMDGTGILGGLELMELVRNNFPELPLLALTDFPNDEARKKAHGMGVPVLAKPVSGEIEGALPSFAPRLFAALSKVESAGGAALTGSRVNIGDELRLEMGEEPALPAPQLGQSVGVSQLRGMLEELNNPQLGGGIILLVLRFAAEFMNRAVMLLVKKESLEGLGQFGVDDQDGSADLRIRNLRIPRSEPSLFAPVLETKFPLKGGLDQSSWSGFFLEQLGEARPLEAFVGPIVSEGKVVALLYGDNLPEQKPIGDTESLEIFLSQAGLAMEKALLQRRLQDRGRGEM